MRRFNFENLPLEGLKLITRSRLEDPRGFLSRLFCSQEFSGDGLQFQIQQVNQTLTKVKGTVRGLHFQASPHIEAKVVSCIRGTVFDVAVDLRKNSQTFLKWHAQILSSENQNSFYIPRGFAHGFQSLEPDTELIYFHNEIYSPESEGVFSVHDPRLSIPWPEKITEISDRDKKAGKIADDFEGLVE